MPAKGFLRPALKRPNLKVVTNAAVRRLRFAGKRVIGVEYWQGDQVFQADARLETVLAAGAVSSPQILQCSGIGPAALLQQHGIPVVHDLPGVGENLQDHLQLRMAFKVKNTRTLNETAGSLNGEARHRPAIYAVPERPAVDVTQPARRICALG